MSAACSARCSPRGLHPRTPTRISLLRQRNAGQRKAPMRTVALGANCDGGAWAHTDTSPHLTATVRTTKAPGVPVVPGTADHHPRRPEEQTPNQHQPKPNLSLGTCSSQRARDGLRWSSRPVLRPA